MSEPRKGECLIPEMGVIGTAADYNQAEMLDYEQRRNTQLEEECGALREEKADLLGICEELYRIIPGIGGADDIAHEWLKLRDAIAKARGKK